MQTTAISMHPRFGKASAMTHSVSRRSPKRDTIPPPKITLSPLAGLAGGLGIFGLLVGRLFMSAPVYAAPTQLPVAGPAIGVGENLQQDKGISFSKPPASIGSAPVLQPPPKPPNIVLEGDSLSVPIAGTYGYSLKALLAEEGLQLQSEATQSERLDQMLQQVDSVHRRHFDPTKNNVVLLWGGTNDIAAGFTAEQAYQNLLATAQAYKDRGWKVVVLTLIYARPNQSDDNLRRAQFNNKVSLFTPKPPWDALVKLHMLRGFGPHDPLQADMSFYAGDRLHLNAIGADQVAKEVHTTLRAVLGLP